VVRLFRPSARTAAPVIPAVIAFLFTARPGLLLALAWSSGTLATIIGLYVSYVTDSPTGPVVVCAFALTLIAAFIVRSLTPRAEPERE
jgi:ABC-type Mn2+/Zn2+ transport system permease subunit